MKKALKIFLVVISLVLVIMLGAKFWIESNFMRILNKNEERKFDLRYDNISIDFTLNGILLEDITITPTDTLSGAATAVYGTVSRARLEGIDLMPILFSDKLVIDKLLFTEPAFVVYLKSDTTKQRNVRKGMGQLFGELIKGAALKNFAIESGNLEIYKTRPDTVLFGSVETIRVSAADIRTDKERIDFVIPFELGQLHSHLEKISYVVDEYRDMEIAAFDFNSEKNQLVMNDISMAIDTSWLVMSRDQEYHKDLIGFSLKSLVLDGVNMTNVYADHFKLHARTIHIDSLDLNDFRNKKMPEPPDIEKPMFKGMLDQINVPVDVDSIIINNADIAYTELAPKGESAGTIRFSNINGYIEDVTTDTVRQDTLENFHAHLDALINQEAKISFDLMVPYSTEHFYLDARIEPFDMRILNPTMEPLAKLRIDSGRMETFHLKMSANRVKSQNEMTLSYKNLKLSVLDRDEGEKDKSGLLSTLANMFVKKDDDSGKGGVSSVEYVTERDIYRGPFNYMWQSVKEGMKQIAPSTVGSIIIPGNKKEEKE